MSTAKRVQLRGGTSDEHSEFVGAEREVTVDITNKTLRIHDGITPGGNRLSTSNELTSETNKINKRIDDIQHNIASSHNHDSLYIRKVNGNASNLIVDNIQLIGRDLKINGKRALVGYNTSDGNKMVINFDNDYGNGVDIYGEVRIPNNCVIKGRRPFLDRNINGYYGLCTPEANDVDWIRTTKNGIIPYQSGGYSSIGTSSWRFADGWFNNINTKNITVAKNGRTSSIDFPANGNDPGFIRHLEDNNTAGLYFSASDDRCDGDRFYFGSAPSGNFSPGAYLTTDGKLRIDRYLDMGQNYIMFNNGKRVYFDGSRPSDAPDGSISFG